MRREIRRELFVLVTEDILQSCFEKLSEIYNKALDKSESITNEMKMLLRMDKNY